MSFLVFHIAAALPALYTLKEELMEKTAAYEITLVDYEGTWEENEFNALMNGLDLDAADRRQLLIGKTIARLLLRVNEDLNASFLKVDKLKDLGWVLDASRIDKIEMDVADMKGDVADLKGDVADLKGDVADLKGDVADLKGDVADMKKTLDRIALWVDRKIQEEEEDDDEEVGVGTRKSPKKRRNK